MKHTLLLLMTFGAFNAGACEIDLPPADNKKIIYTWLLAERGTLRDGGDVKLPVGQPVTCDALKIDIRKFDSARWLYVGRYDPVTGIKHYDRLTPTGPVCNMDIDGDGRLTIIDFDRVRAQYLRGHHYGIQAVPRSGDFNGDGVVNFLDIGELAARLSPRVASICRVE